MISLRLAVLRCPVCVEVIQPNTRFFGLLRRYPSRCAHCGARLGYDTTGGVHEIEPTPYATKTDSEG